MLADALGIDFEVTESLREYDVGVLEGRSDDTAWRHYDALHAAWIRGDLDARIEAGESYTEICARFQPLLDQVRASDADNVLLLGHGGTLYCVLSKLCANLDRSAVFARGLGHTDVVVTQLTPRGLECVTWGDSPM
jgi:broad specificity phosphatase PhoE